MHCFPFGDLCETLSIAGAYEYKANNNFFFSVNGEKSAQLYYVSYHKLWCMFKIYTKYVLMYKYMQCDFLRYI